MANIISVGTEKEEDKTLQPSKSSSKMFFSGMGNPHWPINPPHFIQILKTRKL